MQKLHHPDSKPTWYRDSKNTKKSPLYHRNKAKLQVLVSSNVILAINLSAHVKPCDNKECQELLCF